MAKTPSAGAGAKSALPNRYLPPQQQKNRAFGSSPGRPPPTVLTQVCCVGGGAKCSQSSGDSSPEPTARYAAAAASAGASPPADSTYRSWRGGTGESGDYWHVEQPGGSSGALSCVAAGALPQAVGDYELSARHHQAASLASGTFHLRPDTNQPPASFSFAMGSAVATAPIANHRSHHQSGHSYLRQDSQEGSQRSGRGSSAEPPRTYCDDIVKPSSGRLGGSVPSSPSSGGSGGSRLPLWGSFRSASKKTTTTPMVEKRQCSPHVKTAS